MALNTLSIMALNVINRAIYVKPVAASFIKRTTLIIIYFAMITYLRNRP